MASILRSKIIREIEKNAEIINELNENKYTLVVMIETNETRFQRITNFVISHLQYAMIGYGLYMLFKKK